MDCTNKADRLIAQSIYEDDVQLDPNYDDPEGARCFVVAVPGPHAIRLRVHLPRGYPSKDPPIAQVAESFGLTDVQRDEIINDLVRVLGAIDVGDGVCLMAIVRHVADFHL